MFGINLPGQVFVRIRKYHKIDPLLHETESERNYRSLAGDDLADGVDWISLFEPPPGCRAPPICHSGFVVKFCLPLPSDGH